MQMSSVWRGAAKPAVLAGVVLVLSGRAEAADFAIDTSALATIPKASLPKTRLKLKAFGRENVVRALAGTDGRVLQPMKVGRGRVVGMVGEWRVERDPTEGSVLIARQNVEAPARPPSPPVAATEAKVKALGLDRLTKFGISADEVGDVSVQKLVSRDLDGTAPSAVQLVSQKVFVFRAINGVPVQGHRAVLTYAADTSFRRVLLHWPAIADSGNRLTTRLGVQEITRRAVTALGREKVPTGSSVKLRWKYVPVVQPNGEVKLTLIVGARVAPTAQPTEAEFTEPRELEVPIDAV